ncbi:MAG: hypothetical protein P9L93_02060 [Candidatus Gorgyraea atricola]|nr:hypothetical protein [Candidatus Gorgyraea atricola]
MQDAGADKKQQSKWYLKTGSIVAAFVFVGPFALPLVWLTPDYSRNKKIVITIIVVIVTYFLGILVINSLKTIAEYYRLLGS